MEINTIISSKNRACQLELLLRSLTMPACVLYTCDPEFEAGYTKVSKMYPETKFVRETHFKTDLLNLIAAGQDYVMFAVDDDVQIRPFSEDALEFTEFTNNPEIICLSLRLSPDYRWHGQPELVDNKWQWQQYARGSSHYHEYLRIWGYPMAVGANILRRADVLETLALAGEIKNPSYLEGALNLKTPNRPWVKCLNKAVFINNEANQVQKDFFSRTVGISTQELETRFMQGERLSLTDIIQKASRVRDYFIKTPYLWEYATN